LQHRNQTPHEPSFNRQHQHHRFTVKTWHQVLRYRKEIASVDYESAMHLAGSRDGGRRLNQRSPPLRSQREHHVPAKSLRPVLTGMNMGLFLKIRAAKAQQIN
jgi:hypothetical protein